MHILHSIVRELVRNHQGTITDKDEDEDGNIHYARCAPMGTLAWLRY